MKQDVDGRKRLLEWQRRHQPRVATQWRRSAADWLKLRGDRDAPPTADMHAKARTPGHGWMPHDPAFLAETIEYACNLCGADNRSIVAALGREAPTCHRCGSTVRLRSIIDLLSRALFDRSLSIRGFPCAAGKCGIGVSDAPAYASRLARRLAYVNTFYHQPPRLDICAPDPALHGSCDFVIASDVLEHVVPPVASAFEGVRSLLRDGGAFIGSVPYSLDEAPTCEHFPHLHEFHVTGTADQRRLHNRRRDGTEETFDALVFHGGDGATLEMRVFSRVSLVAELSAAGFSRIAFADQDVLSWGIVWLHPWSIPFIAFK
jgi:hypothetical protein